MDETLISYGSALKALGDGKVGGHLVIFSDQNTPDLEGDYFDASTDFGIESGDKTAVYYNHGLDKTIKNKRIGSGVLELDDVGVWMVAQLNLRNEYEKAIYEMIEAGKMGLSSGTASHLVEREQKGKVWHIKSWPLGIDASITPTPAEPRTNVIPLKSLVKPATEDTAQADQTAAASVKVNAEPVNHNTEPINKEPIMSDQNQDAQDEGTQAVEYAPQSDVDGIKTQLNAIMEMLQKSPALNKTGYKTDDGGAADPGHKSFGDFLLAIYRGDVKRLSSVYKARKDIGENVGVQGGFLVPEEFSNQLLQVAASASQITPLVTRVPVRVNSGTYPALDQFITPTAGSGQTALAAGVTAAQTEAGATLTETQPTFEEIQWRLHKVGGYVEADNELIADSPQSIEALLTSLFGVAIANKNERNIIRGSGAGEPMGILNSNCVVAVTTASDNVFAEADALGMFARWLPVSGKPASYRWLMHRGVIPDLAAFTASNQDFVDWRSPLGNLLLGIPIVYSEHMPNANTDDVILADLGAYLWFEHVNGLMIDYSPHAAFTSDKGTWRFVQRNDGQPWMRAAITQASPTAYTTSPFVYHDD